MPGKRFLGLSGAAFLAALVLQVLTMLPLAALPCVDSYLPDTSGEYVYYKDNTFLRKSYIGFLYYNDSAFCARYYAPADTAKKLPPKDITLLVSVNPDSNHFIITGEKFLTTIAPGQEDADIVNYLHDLMYDFTERRQKVWEVSPETVEQIENFCDRGIKMEEDYPQFGGNVTIYYDYLVPIFNIRKIVSSDGNVMFEAATAGQLVSSTDKSFTDFKGFSENLFDSENSQKITIPEEKESFIIRSPSGVNQKIELDSLWQQSMDNVWFMGSKALVSVNVVPMPESEKEKYLNMLQRRLILGTEGSYIVWQNLDLQALTDNIKVSSYYYQNDSGSLTKDTKILTKLNEKEYGFITLTVFYAEYRSNHSYFDSILNSYKIEK